MPVLRRFGFVHFQRHLFTDATGLRQRFPFSSMNVSSGSCNWHSHTEYLNTADVEKSLEMATELIAALGNRRYDYDASNPDVAQPPVEVTGLILPIANKRPRKSLCAREY